MAAKKSGLGRGLDALFSDNTTESANSMTVRLSQLEPNRDQPRKDFDPVALQELADSIAQHGLIQPILVRPLETGGYQIVAGERRWRASRLAGLSEVPVVIREMSDTEVMEIALIENLQREDLNPVEEALGYQNLMETCHLTQEEVAAKVGKSRPAVTNALRLLHLNETERAALRNGEISAGHARALLGIDDPETRKTALAMAKSGATVRELETLARGNKPVVKHKVQRDPFFTELELAAKEDLRRKVKVKTVNQKKGTLEIEFYDKDDLKDIIQKLSQS